MLTVAQMTPEATLAVLRAAGEETRLRVLLLLARGELTVTDLTQILGQSQPRISRHLKLLVDSGLVERVREGSWAFYRLADGSGAALLLRDILAHVHTSASAISRDFDRLDTVRNQRAERAAEYFSAHASEWDEIRSLHVEEAKVEDALLALLDGRRFGTVVDLGTGTGRILELLAPSAETGIGLDLSPDMLAIARTTLDRNGISHCRVRQGDIYNVPLERESADLVVIHQVLHYLDDPLRAIQEAAGLLRPGGLLAIVDFAPHELEFLRDDHAHQRLGFDSDQMMRWLLASGLEFETASDLSPADNSGMNKLTVSIWLARDPRPVAAWTVTGTEASS